MNFLNKIFSKKETPFEKLKSNSQALIISTYRRIGLEHNSPPSSKTTDKEIMDIYLQILEEFRNVSREKGYILEAPIVNYIVLHFINVYETYGKEFYLEHLEYEIEVFKSSGLRDSFKERKINFL